VGYPTRRLNGADMHSIAIFFCSWLTNLFSDIPQNLKRLLSGLGALPVVFDILLAQPDILSVQRNVSIIQSNNLYRQSKDGYIDKQVRPFGTVIPSVLQVVHFPFCSACQFPVRRVAGVRRQTYLLRPGSQAGSQHQGKSIL